MKWCFCSIHTGIESPPSTVRCIPLSFIRYCTDTTVRRGTTQRCRWILRPRRPPAPRTLVGYLCPVACERIPVSAVWNCGLSVDACARVPVHRWRCMACACRVHMHVYACTCTCLPSFVPHPPAIGRGPGGMAPCVWSAHRRASSRSTARAESIALPSFARFESLVTRARL
jgi:hypothetical protein